MSGFWQPIYGLLISLCSKWIDLLLQGLPAFIREYFKFVSSPLEVQVETIEQVKLLSDTSCQKSVAIHVGRSFVLEHRCLIPKEAIRDAKNAVRLEVERALPIASSGLLYVFKLGQVNAQGNIEVTISAIRKKLADQLFSNASAGGKSIERVTLRGATSDEDVQLPFSSIQRRNWLRIGLVASLLASMIMILGLLPKIYLERLHAGIEYSDQRIRELRQQTEKVAGLQRQVRAMQSLAQAVQGEQEQAQILDLFVQLTESSPDTVVFEELRLDGRRLFVRGTAMAPEEWVLDLQDNEAFKNVTLESVLGATSDLGRKFEIRLDAIWPHERGRNVDE